MATLARQIAKTHGGKTSENHRVPVSSLYFDPKFDLRDEPGNVQEIVENLRRDGFWADKPIPVRPNSTTSMFEIVDGRNRFRACKLVFESGDMGNWDGLIDINPKTMSDSDLLFKTLTANDPTQKPFSMMEEGSYFKKLNKEFDIEPEDIAKKIGKSITYVSDRLALANVDSSMKDEFKSYIQEGKLSPTAAAKIAKISDKDERDRVWKEMKSSHNAQVKEATKNELPQETVNGKKVTVVISPNGHPKVLPPKKMKVSDVVKKSGKGTEHVSIKILKKNLEKCQTMFKETGSDYWECGVKVLTATLANKEVDF